MSDPKILRPTEKVLIAPDNDNNGTKKEADSCCLVLLASIDLFS